MRLLSSLTDDSGKLTAEVLAALAGVLVRHEQILVVTAGEMNDVYVYFGDFEDCGVLSDESVSDDEEYWNGCEVMDDSGEVEIWIRGR